MQLDSATLSHGRCSQSVIMDSMSLPCQTATLPTLRRTISTLQHHVHSIRKSSGSAQVPHVRAPFKPGNSAMWRPLGVSEHAR